MDRHRLLVTALAAASGAALAPVAVSTIQAADATYTDSGQHNILRTQLGTGDWTEPCDLANVDTGSTVWAGGYQYAYMDGYNTCDGVNYKNLPPGYHRLLAWNVKNGSTCNFADFTNNVETYAFGVGVPCANQSGTQSWRGWVQAEFYKGGYCSPGDCDGGYYTPYGIFEGPVLNA